MFEQNNSECKSIVLGYDVCNKSIFKVLEVLCVDEGPLKPIWDKPTEKLLNVDSLDYLKYKYKIQTEDTSTQFSENGLSHTKRCCKRKLYPFVCQLLESKDGYVTFLSPLLDTTKPIKGNELSKWFSQKFIANNYASPPKFARRERSTLSFNINSDVIYAYPIFYKSKPTMVINNSKIIFNLYLKEWFKVELLFEFVKSMTIYAKSSFIKVSIRTKIADEISKLYQKYNLPLCDIFKASPKKTTLLKDVMLVFTSNRLSKDDYHQLVELVGTKKMIWNECEIEAQDLLENILQKNSKRTEIISKGDFTNWSVLFKSESKERPLLCKGSVPLLPSCSVYNIPPPPPPITSINIEKIPPPITSSNNIKKAQPSSMLLHNIRTNEQLCVTSSNIITFTPFSPLAVKPKMPAAITPKLTKRQTKQTSSSSKVMKIQPQTPILVAPQHIAKIPPQSPQISSTSQTTINYIVTTPAPMVNFDSMSNIFHRMRTDSQATIPYQLSTLTPNISNVALNEFIANGARSSQSMINLPVVIKVEGTDAANNNAGPKQAPSNTLCYIPSRNVSNIFETFHYNPSPESDVLIHGSDLLCLNSGQYLNDNIINFYLNFIRYEIMSEDQRHRTYLFNVFFNIKLQGTPGNTSTDTAETRHARVAKWTKKVDIFDKDFILIPICENQHWFLAIICFPWMAGMISYDKLLGNIEDEQHKIPSNESKFAKIDRVKRVQKLREDYKVEPSPCILLFDSLQYTSRASNVKLIREYLETEWESKRGAIDGPLVFNKNTVRGFNPQVPQQTNNIDCGIFVLHYVEQFFINPLPVFTKEYFQSSLLAWFDNETVSKKRATIQKMVLAKADAYQAHCATTDHITQQFSTANIEQNYDDSGPDIQIL